MNPAEWESIADRYGHIQDARIVRVFPAAIEMILASNTRSVLDYGCGEGLLAEGCLRAGVEQVTLYDPTARMRELARSRLRAWGDRVRLAARLDEIPTGAFDAVAFMGVWMCLSSRSECLACLTTLRESLREGGLLIAAVTHPCFRDRQFSTFRTSFRMENYANEGTPFQVTMFDCNHTCEFTDFHWSLGEMSRQLREARLTIEEFIEVPDVETDRLPRVFPWLIIRARRM